MITKEQATKARKAKARKAEADLDHLKYQYGFVGSVCSLREGPRPLRSGVGGLHEHDRCFDVIYDAASKGPVIVYRYGFGLILCRQIVTDEVIKEYAKAEAECAKYKEYLQ
jgi:hypothetical protein